jgi:hypothetical protein
MQYTIITSEGYGLPVAWHLANNGNKVQVGMVQDQSLTRLPSDLPPASEPAEQRRRRLSLYEGILPKADAAELLAAIETQDPNDNFTFLDLNSLFWFAQPLNGSTVRGNFPTEEDLRFELDRKKAKDFVAEHYPRLSEGKRKVFSRAQDACDFLEQSNHLWVLKGNADSAPTVVPHSLDTGLAKHELMSTLTLHAEDYESAGFILERLVRNVVEITPEKFYYDGVPVATLVCIENKQLGAGNLGPMTDCAQDLVFATAAEDAINEIAFPPVVDELAQNHKGLFVWDASIYFDEEENELYFGEFCSNRVGYSSFYTELTLAGGAGRFFEAVTQAENPFPRDKVATSVRLFNLNREAEHAFPRAGLMVHRSPEVDPHFWPVDVRLGSKGTWETAGYTDSIGVITGKGSSVAESAEAMHAHARLVSVEGILYRPLSDFLSRDYPSSIVNRLNAGLAQGLYTIGFGVA